MSGGTVVTIGNFDGVHLGHQSLVRAARDAAGPGGRVVAMVFHPHPVTVLRPGSVLQRLTTFEARVDLLKTAGVDEVVAIEPTAELLGSSPEAFIAATTARFRPSTFVEGVDFRFGHSRAGDVDLLARLGDQHGFGVVIVPPVEGVLSDHTIVPVSSSLVRWLLERGRVDDVQRLLGRPHEISGTVERGDQRGRLLDAPTANVAARSMLPADGVYFGTACAPDGRWFAAAINVGSRPTFSGTQRRCEVHLVDAHLSLNAYGWECRVRFQGFLRNEIRFDGPAAVQRQIHRDIDRVRELVAGLAVAS